MVSRRRKGSDTHVAILEAARGLLEERGFYGVGLEEVARAAGVSRQAVYLQFGSKGRLLLDLFKYVGRVEGVPGFVERIKSAPDAVAMLAALVRFHARFTPRIHRLAVVLDTARRTDP